MMYTHTVDRFCVDCCHPLKARVGCFSSRATYTKLMAGPDKAGQLFQACWLSSVLKFSSTHEICTGMIVALVCIYMYMSVHNVSGKLSFL